MSTESKVIRIEDLRRKGSAKKYLCDLSYQDLVLVLRLLADELERRVRNGNGE